MTKFASLLLILFSSVVLTACSSSPSTHETAENNQQALVDRDSLMQVFKVWQGTPYRLGGTALNGVDCSAFVQTAVNEALHIPLPRTTKQQVNVGFEIDYDEAKIGDLVFFKTSWQVRHVGVFIGNHQFMHASTSKGVIISRLDNPYWASKFWHFRRVNTRL